jgi:pimeloyl-ACP methyl ester carboxylesterase
MNYRFTNPVPPEQYQAQVAAGAGMAMLSEDDVANRMSQIQVPVLILFGEGDRVVPPGNAELLAQKLAEAEINILPNVGHIFPIEDPGATVGAITEFLA